MDELPVIARRLRQAREARQLSQERLGVLAGIDEYSASARMNQYERGKHAPDYAMVTRIAAVLNYPPAFFYADSDDEAALLATARLLSPAGLQRTIAFAYEQLAAELKK